MLRSTAIIARERRAFFVKLLLAAAVALIDPVCRVLIAQRPPDKSLAGLWEFPGGKVESDERPEAALIRELREELGIAVEEACLAPFSFASFAYPDFHLLMPLYICRRWTGVVTARENQTLKWVFPKDLRAYPMPPADAPLIPALLDLLGG
jgi:8-oxo-dGTP diphosphatase